MITVGVTGVGGGIGQSAVRSLANASLETRVIGMDAGAMNAGMYWTDASYIVPMACDEEAYVSRLLEICSRESLDVLIPGLDYELAPLARHRERFQDRGCAVVISSLEAIGVTRDKQALHDFCRAQALPFVATTPLSEAQKSAEDLTYPVIVKPNFGSGSAGTRIVFDAGELRKLPTDANLIVQTYLPPPDWDPSAASRNGTQLDQRDEYGMQYMINLGGEILGSFISVIRLHKGVPFEVVPFPDSPVYADGLRIATALAELGARGPLNLQGRLTASGFQFFEVNARFTGTTACRSALGYREVEAVVLSFVKGDDEAARRKLVYSCDSIVWRTFQESIVPRSRVERLKSEQSLTSTAPLPTV